MFANFPFVPGSDVLLESLNSWDYKNFRYEGINPSVSRDNANPFNVPGRLRVADLDKDGFPDIIITLDFMNLQTNVHTSRTVILTNKAASGEKDDSVNRQLGQILRTDDNPIAKIS